MCVFVHEFVCVCVFACLFVCLFVCCFFDCLFVCLFVIACGYSDYEVRSLYLESDILDFGSLDTERLQTRVMGCGS